MINDVLKSIWPEWQVEGDPLGKGAYGVVYKGVRREHDLESYSAIKVISIRSDSPEVDALRSDGLDESATKTYLNAMVKDFVSEIRMMESLKGVQNIVSVEDFKVVEKDGGLGWDIYIRMELLTPFNKFASDNHLTESDVRRLGCDICTALEICGKRNIIHRDIKPDNIFVNDFGYFKLGDFGIARKMENMTGGLSQKGTFNYMAPEVATGHDYDHRVDIYSLGILLYKLLNGNRLPFMDDDKQLLNPTERKNAIERRIRGENLTPPKDASRGMADIILKACAFDPKDRFASATEMKEALMNLNTNAESKLTGDETVRMPDLDSDKTVKLPEVDADATVKLPEADVTVKIPEFIEDKTVALGALPDLGFTNDGTMTDKQVISPLDTTYRPEEPATPYVEFGGLANEPKSESAPMDFAPVSSYKKSDDEPIDMDYLPTPDLSDETLERSLSTPSSFESDLAKKIITFGLPVVSLALYAAFYMILIPSLYGRTLSFLNWILADVNHIVEILSDANNILVPAYSIVMLVILQYVLLGLFIGSLIYMAKQLHSPKKSYDYEVKYIGKEPRRMLGELYEDVKGNSGVSRTTLQALRLVCESMKFSKEFGISKDMRVLMLESEICDIIDDLQSCSALEGESARAQFAEAVKLLKQKSQSRDNLLKK